MVRKNSFQDPVAQSIRNEQMRDAMPPKEELHGPKECDKCGVANDTVRCRMKDHPDCPGIQDPPLEYGRLLCDPCYDEWNETIEERALERAQSETVVGIVFYECGNHYRVTETEPDTIKNKVQVDWDDDDEPVYEVQEQVVGHPAPTCNFLCERCGASIDYAIELDDEDKEVEDDG